MKEKGKLVQVESNMRRLLQALVCTLLVGLSAAGDTPAPEEAAKPETTGKAAAPSSATLYAVKADATPPETLDEGLQRLDSLVAEWPEISKLFDRVYSQQTGYLDTFEVASNNYRRLQEQEVDNESNIDKLARQQATAIESDLVPLVETVQGDMKAAVKIVQDFQKQFPKPEPLDPLATGQAEISKKAAWLQYHREAVEMIKRLQPVLMERTEKFLGTIDAVSDSAEEIRRLERQNSKLVPRLTRKKQEMAKQQTRLDQATGGIDKYNKALGVVPMSVVALEKARDDETLMKMKEDKEKADAEELERVKANWNKPPEGEGAPASEQPPPAQEGLLLEEVN